MTHVTEDLCQEFGTVDRKSGLQHDTFCPAVPRHKFVGQPDTGSVCLRTAGGTSTVLGRSAPGQGHRRGQGRLEICHVTCGVDL